MTRIWVSNIIIIPINHNKKNLYYDLNSNEFIIL